MRNSENCCDLNTCFLCRLSIRDWLPAIEVHKKNITVKKGEQILKEGEPLKGIFFVYSGMLKIHKKWDDEKELILRFAKKGDIVGYLGLGKTPYYPITATALEASTLCFVDMEFFESTLKVNTDVTYEMLMFFAAELQESEKRMRNLAHMPVKGRAAQALLSLKKQFGVDADGYVNVDLNRQDIASYTGSTYETLFRMINEMLKDDLIAVNGKRFLLKNEPALLKLTEEDHVTGV